MQISVGADPEFALFDTQRKMYVSAHDMIPGTKHDPYPVDKGAIQVDGVAVEFNIDPAVTEDQFVDNIKTVVRQLRELIHPRYQFHYVPAVSFDKGYFGSLPSIVLEIGCIPDFSGYTFMPNNPPNGFEMTTRGFGGHLHAGWQRNSTEIDADHHRDCGYIARNLDYFLGIPSLSWDKDKRRRVDLTYGQAGCYRPKPYGIEYRTLSNAWLRSEMLQRFVFRQMVLGVEDYWGNKPNCEFMKHPKEKAVQLINNG